MLHDQLKKVLRSLTARERPAREHILKMIAQQTEPFRAVLARIRVWTDCRHTANSGVSDSNTAKRGSGGEQTVYPKPALVY
jgi:hypothetical protein